MMGVYRGLPGRHWVAMVVGVGLAVAGCGTGDTGMDGSVPLDATARVDITGSIDLTMDQGKTADLTLPLDLSTSGPDGPQPDISLLPDLTIPDDLTVLLDFRPPPDQMPPPPADMAIVRDLLIGDGPTVDGGKKQLSFAAAMTMPQGAAAISLATGDANGDSKSDLFLALSGKAGVQYFANNGALVFAAPVEVGVVSQPSYVTVGDLDGDKRPEVVAVSADQLLTVRINGGMATYAKGSTYMLPMGPSSVELGDFNGDKNLDAVVAAKDASNVSVLAGKGDGTLNAASMTNVAMGGSYAVPLDFDKDGKLDVAVAAPPGQLGTYLGLGNGLFMQKAVVGAGFGAQHVAVGRLNGDAFDDLVVSCVQASKITVYLGDANGVFKAGVDYQTAGMPAASGIADFDQDGALDIAVGTFNLVQIFRGVGDGTYVLGPSLQVNGNNRCVVPVDLDGDGLVDLALCNANNLAIIRNTSM